MAGPLEADHRMEYQWANDSQRVRPNRLGNALFALATIAVLIMVACMMAGCASAPDQTVQLTIAADSLAASEVVLTGADKLHAIPAADRAPSSTRRPCAA